MLLNLTFLAALGAGLIAGLFFAFSTFVMKALAWLPREQGLRAMQSLNVTILRPSFLGVFLGTAVVSLILGGLAVSSWEQRGAPYLLLGSALYLLGVIGVTMAFNVPRNEALAAIDPASPDAAGLWARYVSGWTAWNHVRTVSALGATASFILVLWR